MHFYWVDRHILNTTLNTTLNITAYNAVPVKAVQRADTCIDASSGWSPRCRLTPHVHESCEIVFMKTHNRTGFQKFVFNSHLSKAVLRGL